jgi:hypothetical protein
MVKQYKNDYLSQVIIKVDFAMDLVSIQKDLNSDLIKVILNYFQVPEPRKMIGRKFQISNQKIESSKEESMEWRYFNRDHTKLLTLNPMFMVIDYKKHVEFDNVKKEFIDILKSLFDSELNIQISRFGLRYINNIELNENDPTNWTKYINKNLLSIFNFYEDSQALSRILNHIEFNFDDLKLRFQSGVRNSDYPATIKRKVFVLDLDCYYNGLLNDVYAVEDKASRAHDKIYEIFDKSITEKLKKMMNE